MKHELKIWPQYFCRIADGSKTFELRKNDRDFQTGDEVVLKEYDPDLVQDNAYTGKELIFRIGYILAVEPNRVVFSLLPLEGKL